MLTEGCEWIVDARGCDPARVGDLTTLRALFARIISELHLTPVAEPIWHVFPEPGGITGLVALAESHLTVHTFPEHGSLCINLFCCKPRGEWPWLERLRDAVGADQVDVSRVERNYSDVGRSLPSRATALPRSRAGHPSRA